MLEPMAMLKARSIWFFSATSTAVLCSAALPMMATAMTPTKTSVRPSTFVAGSTACTSSSLIQATSAVAPNKTKTAVRGRIGDDS